MSLFIAGVAVLGTLAAAYAQDRRFSALAEFAGGRRADRAPSEVDGTDLAT